MDDNIRSIIIGIAVLIVGVVCLALSITNITTESFQYLGIFGAVGTVLGLLITIPSVKSIKHG
ncbi:MAG: hypothetical protein D4R96_02130 [Nitrosopumilaceae archaeon]|nr:MAG: hypothetical protein D4R96_02130 [Nitrosopumilaceae archaeon]